MSTELLKDVYDLHIHPAPDVVKRKATDTQIAKKAVEAGMKGFAIKSHYFDTSGRTAIIKEIFPQCNAVGGIVLNLSVGGLNPAAVEMAAKAGTKIVWLPTMDAFNMWDFLRANHSPVPFGSAKTDPDSVKGIHILEGGKLSSSVYEILDLIKEYNLVLATGHISKHESLAVFKEAEKRGIEKMIATHTEFPATYADIEEQKEYIKCGAKIEHNYLTILNKEFTMEKLKEQIQAVGAEHVILSSDLGQYMNPDPVEGFGDFLEKILEAGISQHDIYTMTAINTRELVE